MPPIAIVAIVLACIVAVIILLLSLRIHIRVGALNTDFTVNLRILFLKFRIYPKKKRAYKKDKTRKKRKPASDKKKSKKTEKKKKRNITHTIRLITHVIKKLYARFPAYFKLKLNRAVVVIGGQDASDAAIKYGAARAGIVYLLTACETLFTFKTPRRAKLAIEPNFLTDESLCDIDIDLSVSVGGILKLLLRALFAFQEGKRITAKRNLPSSETTQMSES